MCYATEQYHCYSDTISFTGITVTVIDVVASVDWRTVKWTAATTTEQASTSATLHIAVHVHVYTLSVNEV